MTKEEKAWNAKLEKAKRGEYVEFDSEELEFLIYQNEHLNGNHVDMSKIK